LYYGKLKREKTKREINIMKNKKDAGRSFTPGLLVPVCRCNNCMTYFHEDITECPKCKTDGYLMDTPELAAAPELLAALELSAQMLEAAGDALEGFGDEGTRGSVRSAFIEARAAIHKAKGGKV